MYYFLGFLAGVIACDVA